MKESTRKFFKVLFSIILSVFMAIPNGFTYRLAAEEEGDEPSEETTYVEETEETPQVIEEEPQQEEVVVPEPVQEEVVEAEPVQEEVITSDP